ncbi:MAG: hypothetical protein AAFX94_14320 [Myxococcota bacterium]
MRLRWITLATAVFLYAEAANACDPEEYVSAAPTTVGVANAVKQLAEAYGCRLLIGPGVQLNAEVDALDLMNVTLRDALDGLVGPLGYRSRFTGRSVTIEKPNAPERKRAPSKKPVVRKSELQLQEHTEGVHSGYLGAAQGICIALQVAPPDPRLLQAVLRSLGPVN